MHIPERLEYLNKNRKSGDLTLVARELALSYSTVCDIMAGKFYGTHAEKVLEKLEEIIEKRSNQSKFLSKKYRKKISDSL